VADVFDHWTPSDIIRDGGGSQLIDATYTLEFALEKSRRFMVMNHDAAYNALFADDWVKTVSATRARRSTAHCWSGSTCRGGATRASGV